MLAGALLAAPANANHFGSGPDPASAISGANRNPQIGGNTGNPNLNPGYLRQQWLNSLPPSLQQLYNDPSLMDSRGRLPGQPGYKVNLTTEQIAREAGLVRDSKGRWRYKGQIVPNQPGSSGMSWGSAPQNTQAGRQGAGACQGQCGNVPDKKP